MNKINESDLRAKLGTVAFHGKEYYKLPTLICKKHFSLCNVMLNNDKNGVKFIEIDCNSCKTDEEKINEQFNKYEV